MGSNTDWGSNFATAGVDAMSAYDEILVPRVFNAFADELAATLPASSLGPQIAALEAEGRAALLAAAEAALEPYVHDGELHSEAATHIVVAVR